MNENLGTIYITIEVLNISLQQFYKSKFGTEYFSNAINSYKHIDKSEMTLDIMNKFGALKNMVDLVGSFTKHMVIELIYLTSRHYWWIV